MGLPTKVSLIACALGTPAFALDASDGPLRDDFRACIAAEVRVVEEIVPSAIEAAEILLEYQCIREATLWATEKVKAFGEHSSGSPAFFDQIEQQTQFLMRDAVYYVLTARKLRIGKI
ncbi:hypothetical protein SAMN05444273_10458 [Litoreibacter ascidiaceicola]|uniref:Uncharacterized protein n=1 Tax=Litoreibacter ascidiaceicola TaxID=1486859 RepID=A0A1M4Z684_9RHOB|nr:hypothetical protein [Litoreibacter ascidiaceicola]SHF13531.1 hypothetical protein SAMN05444273_10458 [Litoreibacter ascidiaceicola]